MRTNPAPLSMQAVQDAPRSRVQDTLRTLVTLTRRACALPTAAGDSAEEVLVDTEVDGCRYLLVRMPNPTGAQAKLSPREYEIVRMVAKGHPNKVIADVLNISSWTVCTHLRRIFAKLGVGSRAAMVARLSESGGLNGVSNGASRHFR